MNALNLCEILKGHEGETFYSPIYGNMVLIKVDDRYPYPLYFDTNINNKSVQTFNSDGKPDIFCVECLVFPSKYQRDWNKWIEEQKPKVPKTWSEIIKTKEYNNYRLHYIKSNDEDYYTSNGVTPIEKSALALDVANIDKVTVDKYKRIFNSVFDKAYTLGKQEKDADTVISGWVARDKGGALFIYCHRPKRNLMKCLWEEEILNVSLTDNEFPDLTWESEPQEVELIIKRKKNG